MGLQSEFEDFVVAARSGDESYIRENIDGVPKDIIDMCITINVNNMRILEKAIKKSGKPTAGTARAMQEYKVIDSMLKSKS